MSEFTIYPAIDLRQGKVVRLEHGDPARQTTFGDDPVAMAQRWIDGGATWLHVVNLDGAFDEAGAANWRALEALTQLNARVQFGGGLRSLRDVARALNRGVARVVLGTAAVEDPDIVEDVVRRFGGARVAVGIDSRDGLVRTRGWQDETAVSPIDLGLQMSAMGVETIIYTDISRDGVLTGVDADGAARLAEETGLSVIASGGVASLDDVRRTVAYAEAGVSGLIIGRALYDGKIGLTEALALTA